MAGKELPTGDRHSIDIRSNGLQFAASAAFAVHGVVSRYGMCASFAEVTRFPTVVLFRIPLDRLNELAPKLVLNDRDAFQSLHHAASG